MADGFETTPGEATARMPDGTIVRTLHWAPAGEPWAVAQLVHGLGEHSGRYQPVAEPMARAGIAVHAHDHRGFGGSAGPRAYVERWDLYLDDLERRLEWLRTEYRDLPLVMYGHSMGGLMAAGYVLSDRPRLMPDLLVLSAPGIDDAFPAWKHGVARALGSVVPRLRISNGPVGDGLSRDPAVAAAYLADPLCQPRTTIRLASEGFAEQARVRDAIAHRDAMPIPTYVFHGTRDPVVPVEASEGIGRLGNVTRRVHEGLNHECHHEPEHAAVLAEVIDWLRARVEAGPEGVRGVAGTRV